MYNILITGANGQLGHELKCHAPANLRLLALSSAQLDISNQQQVAQVFAQQSIDLVINAAAYTAVDKAESEPQQAFAVNQHAVRYLAQQAAAAKIPLLHVSTDYVFAGDGERPYLEDDVTAPVSVYGQSKLAGEQELASYLSEHIIVRTSWVFGAFGNNFVKTMLRLAAERDQLSVVSDQLGCPTSAASLAQVLWQLAQQYLQHGKLSWGTYHFSNAPTCSWYEFAREIFTQAQQLGLLTKVPQLTAISSEQFPTAAKRPAWSVLDCKKIEGLLGKPVPAWRDELELVLRELQKEGN